MQPPVVIPYPSNKPMLVSLLSSSQRRGRGAHTGSESSAKTCALWGGGGHASPRARAEGRGEAKGPPPSCSGAKQAHVPFGAHSGAAWPRRNRMLMTIFSTEALA